MSRKTIRHSVADFLSSPQIPGIGTVFPSPPKIGRASDQFAGLPAGTATGSVIYVEVTTIRELRLAAGGPTQGVKQNRYGLRLHFLCRSYTQLAQDAMDAMDDQMELLFERLRQDRTLGTGNSPTQAILQSYQDGSGLSATTGLPKTSGDGSLHIWTIIDGEVVEVVNA